MNGNSIKASYINGSLYSNYRGVIKEVKRINPGDDEALMQALDKYGPITVAIDSSNMKFHQYNTGFYAPNIGDCRKDKPGFLNIIEILKIFNYLLLFIKM